MPRIAAINPAEATGQAHALLSAVQSKLGMAPNLMRTMANQPAVLKAYLDFSEALGGGAFTAKQREAIALTVAGANSCDYCASAHTAISGMLKVDKSEVAANLGGQSADLSTAAALRFAQAVVQKAGLVTNDDLDAVRAAGHGDGAIVEIIGNVALNIFTNYLNHIAETEIDFPRVETVKAA